MKFIYDYSGNVPAEDLVMFPKDDDNIFATNLTKEQAYEALPPLILKQNSGNFYGGSTDVNMIKNFIPSLGEFGGWKNRVSLTRKFIKCNIQFHGCYIPFTRETLEFDNDAELLDRSISEAFTTAQEITEALMQNDLITTASAKGTVFYSGTAMTKKDVVAGLSYHGLMVWKTALTKNRIPKKTKIVVGYKLTDTVTIDKGWLVYIGEELLPTLEALEDYHGEKAWTPVRQYGAATKILPGEEGSIGSFRFISVLKMQSSVNKFGDPVYPILLVGEESFATINYMGNSTTGSSSGRTGSKGKYRTNFVRPGGEGSKYLEPYGQTGFFSLNWYHGFMALRNERLGIFWTTDKLDPNKPRTYLGGVPGTVN